MITEYGRDVFFMVSGVCAAIALGSYLIIDILLLKYLLIGVAITLFLLTLNFFSDPERTPPAGSNLVVSPADGTVVAVKEVVEDEFLRTEAVQISIFMSPLNVHVNRNPVSGTVRYVRYIKGKNLAAFEDKASLDNEQTHVGVDNGEFRIFFKQIAGFVARRIVCTLKEGDVVAAGSRFGMIKFGSRVDVFVPKNSDIKVRMNQKAVAGETVLAVVPHP